MCIEYTVNCVFCNTDNCRVYSHHGLDIVECVSDRDKSGVGRVLRHETTAVSSEDRVHCQPAGS